MPSMTWSGPLSERRTVLRSCHRHALPHRLAEVAALWAFGLRDDEVAVETGLALTTVRNHGRRIRDTVVPPEMAATRANSIAWTWAQRACCMATALRAAAADVHEVSRRVTLLTVHSPTDLTGKQVELLLLQALGFDDAEAARLLNVSSSTIRATAYEARCRAVPPELEATRSNATAWVHLHAHHAAEPAGTVLHG
jgi:DNA-binding NarL/FixJ family response regulator